MREMAITARTEDSTHSVEENKVGVKLAYTVMGTRSMWHAVIGGASTSSNDHCQTKNDLKKKNI